MTTLNDTEVLDLIQRQNLIENLDPDMLSGACYELRMGNVYYDLSEGQKRFELAENQPALIKPGHRVVLITEEELNVPRDMLVRVITKGSFFSIGLSPVSTYADPGFAGNLGLVTQNISDKYLEIPRGEPLAKAEFTRLSGPAEKGYRGQHGFNSGIWPVKSHLQKTYAEVKSDPRVESEMEEALALLPEATATAIRRLESVQTWTNIGLIVAIFLNALTLFAVNTDYLDAVMGVGINLISSILLLAFTAIKGSIERMRFWNSRR